MRALSLIPLLAAVFLAWQAKPNPTSPTDLGLEESRAKRIGQLHREVVAALNDLSSTRLEAQLQSDGTVKMVPPSFGSRRVLPLILSHGGTERYVSGTDFAFGPGLFGIVSSAGRPLNRASFRLDQTKWATGPEWKTASPTVVALSKDGLHDLARGRDYGRIKDGYMVWLKPLFLTRKECLGCHQGMKIGQPVGIAAYVAKKEPAIR